MKKFFLVLICLCFYNIFYAQDNVRYVNNNPNSAVGIENPPEFPGGLNAFAEFIKKNYRVPNVKGLSGKVIVEFIVEMDGRILDCKIISDLGYGTGKELIRVLNESPLWKPGMQDGRLVRCKFTFPLSVDVK